MTRTCLALPFLLLLGGCCGLGAGCGTPTGPSGGVAWDGLGPVPAENTVGEAAPVARVRPAARTIGKMQPGDQWEQEQSSDQAADAKLTRQLRICSNC